MKSVERYQLLSVIYAIWSHALHSGTNGDVLRIHMALVTSLRIFKTHSTAPKSFGIFGGGGRFGSSTVGSVGKSGSSGIVNEGSRANAGKVKDALGTSGRRSAGRFGNTIGLGFKLKSGKYTTNHALTLCKSIIMSGHFGNWIIGGFGIIALMSWNVPPIKSCLSFLHS